MGTGSKKSKYKNKKETPVEKTSDIKAILYIAIGILLAFSTYTDLVGALSFLSRKAM